MVAPVNDSFTVASGVAMYAGLHSPTEWLTPSSIRAVLIGDSLTTHRLGYNWSPFQWINGQAAGALQLIANAGVAGERASDILARVDNAYTNLNPGLSGLGTIGHLFDRNGTNNARAGDSAVSYSATCELLFAKYATYADKIYLLAVPPIGPSEASYAAANALTIQYNTVRAAYAAAHPNQFVYIADDVNLRAGDGSQLPGFFQSDGIHNFPAGTTQEGIDGYTSLASKFTTYNYARATPDAALAEWFTNPTFAGTSGTLGGTFTGTVVTGLSIGANGGGIVAACSIEAATGGDSDTSPWQVVAPTQVTSGASTSIRITSLLSGRTFTGSDPAVLEMMIEIDMRGLDSTYFNSMRLWVQGSGGALTDDLELKIGGGALTKKVLLRSRMPRPNTDSSTAETLFFDLIILASHTGAMGNFRFRHLSIRG